MSGQDSAASWGIKRRRKEIHGIIETLISSGGMTRAEAIDLLARRFLVGFNTVEGWVSEGGAGTRAPPDWKVLDILRYELTLVSVRPLLEWAKTRARPDKAPADQARLRVVTARR